MEKSDLIRNNKGLVCNSHETQLIIDKMQRQWHDFVVEAAFGMV